MSNYLQMSDTVCIPDWELVCREQPRSITNIANRISSTSDILDFTASSDFGNENAMNQLRSRIYESNYSPILMKLIDECTFEFGYETLADQFVRERLDENASVTKEWLNSLFIEYYEDIKAVSGILRIIAHLNYDDVAPQGPLMATAALLHKSTEIQEFGIRAFENWGDPKSLSVLRNLKCQDMWLQEYVSQVISDLEGIVNAPAR